MNRRILIVDDEPDILEILRFNLETEGYEVTTSEAPVALDKDHLPNLILLDVMMTPKSGFEWARELKADPATAHIPIIFCTAKTAESDLLTGFAIGSDDYIRKPFRISEVKARVRAVLKRPAMTTVLVQEPQAEEEPERLYFPAMGSQEERSSYLDLSLKQCVIDGEEVSFTKLEFEVLQLLLSSPGQVFSREKILRAVWPDDTIVLDRTVDVNITRIRKKIGRYGKCLRTKFGYGYYFSK